MTEKEAIEMIQELKELVDRLVLLPQQGNVHSINAKSQKSHIEYKVHINRKSRLESKISFVGKCSTTGELLIRLDVGDETLEHMNPDKTRLFGTHLHIYRDGHELKHAIPFITDSQNLVSMCMDFFNRFGIITDRTNVHYTENTSLFH